VQLVKNWPIYTFLCRSIFQDGGSRHLKFSKRCHFATAIPLVLPVFTCTPNFVQIREELTPICVFSKMVAATILNFQKLLPSYFGHPVALALPITIAYQIWYKSAKNWTRIWNLCNSFGERTSRSSILDSPGIYFGRTLTKQRRRRELMRGSNERLRPVLQRLKPTKFEVTDFSRFRSNKIEPSNCGHLFWLHPCSLFLGLWFFDGTW